MQRVEIIDSHTGGEPTRIVVAGGPELGGGSMDERLRRFRDEHDAFRRAVVCEPRGSDVLVGALLLTPADPSCAAGVIFFNNVGCLQMCGHGTIGIMAALAHLGRIGIGKHRIETPAGVVEATWRGAGEASIVNVPSYRAHAGVAVEVPRRGLVRGDVAWGGNWFFLVKEHGETIAPANIDRLTEFAWAVRREVNAHGLPEVDHVELFGEPRCSGDSRNFVLCPGGAYDRSPCGTGTSAKLACLAADGVLAEGEEWVQESIIGSTFRGSYRWLDRDRGIVEPTITGSAFITSEGALLLDRGDPFCWGLGNDG